MRYMVTGCAGFIASNVTRQLLDAGHEVVGIDELNDAYDPRLKHWRMETFDGRDGFTFSPTDIRDRDALESVANGQDFDAVFNLAARAGVRYSVEDPWVYHATNGEGTLNILDMCRRHDIPRMVLASTSSLYGAHNPRPFHEDADTNRPLSPYAASKKAAEAYSASYTHLHGIHTPVLRYFTVYGPAGRPDMSIFRFIRWIATGTPITLYGDGSQERDFTYVDDIARGTIAALGVEGHDIINLGNDAPETIRSVIDRLAVLLGKEPVIDQKPMHPADVKATWASIDKAKDLLGWTPSVSLDEGLARSVEWYRENEALANAVELGD